MIKCAYNKQGLCEWQGRGTALRPGDCQRCSVDCRQAVSGLGDVVERGLTAVGITHERANRAAKAIGLQGCGCAGRKQWLNEKVPLHKNPGPS